MLLRPETRDDIAGITRVNQLAFGGDDEARIVGRVRDSGIPFISIVADDHGILGHILFSPVTLGGKDDRLLMGLGPMSVLPTRQRQGVGSGLVRAGLEECRRIGAGGVVVVGHPEFYPRFGFSNASAFGLKCEFEVPDDVFMATEFTKDALRIPGGLIRYHPAFSETA
jgi:putative acetyltransferase